MKSAHTPGPWQYGSGKLSNSIQVYVGAQNIASVTMLNHYEPADANARLIAAAPDLLEALRALIKTADMYWTEDKSTTWPALEESREAIAKAIGDYSGMKWPKANKEDGA